MQAFFFALLLIGVRPGTVRPMGKGRKGKPSLSSRASQPLEEWRELPFDELVIACSEAGLPTFGTADVLVSRVHGYYRDVAENDLILDFHLDPRTADFSVPMLEESFAGDIKSNLRKQPRVNYSESKKSTVEMTQQGSTH